MYNVRPLSCISYMLKFVYVLMGHMAYCMNKLLTYLYHSPFLYLVSIAAEVKNNVDVI